MPVTPPTRYLEVVQHFLSHWGRVDEEMSPQALSLIGYTRADLLAAKDALAATMSELEGKTNDWEGWQVWHRQRTAAVHRRISQYRHWVRAQLMDTPEEASLPELPEPQDGLDAWLKAQASFTRHWQRLEADPPAGVPMPITLAGGYGFAQFSADLEGVAEAFLERRKAMREATFTRQERDRQWKEIEARLVQYRLVVKGFFPRSHPLSASLPKLARSYYKKREPEEPTE